MERIMRQFSSQSIISLRSLQLLKCSSPCLPLAWKRNQSSGVKDEPPNDKPITYTKSKAFNYKASQNFRVSEDELTYPNYTSFVIKSSIFIFLAYFCIFRESNDVDEMLSRDLFEIVPELEIPMLEIEVKRLEAHGIKADDLRAKVEELKRLENMKKSSKV